MPIDPQGLARLVAAAQQAGLGPDVPPKASEEPGPQLTPPETPGGLDEAVRKLFPDIDWEAEAAKIVQQSGLKPPVAPGEFKMSPWQWLSVVGPALGALSGGQPGMAAGGAAAVLGGYYGGYQALEQKYREQQAAYTKTVTDLSTKMADRAEKRATLLLPYLAMTADKAAQLKFDFQKYVATLSIDQQKLALEGMRVGLEADRVRETERHNAEEERIRLLALTNSDAAARARLIEDRRHNEATELQGREDAAIRREALAEAAAYHQARINLERQKVDEDDEMKAMKLGAAKALIEWTDQNPNVPPPPKLEAGLSLLFPGYQRGLMNPQELEVVKSVMKLVTTKKQQQITPELRAAYNAIVKRVGGEPLPEPSTTGFAAWIKKWLGLGP